MREGQTGEGEQVWEGREGLTEDEKATADMLYQSIIMRGRRAEGEVAAATSREELERLNPELLDKASGAPGDAGPSRRVRAGARRTEELEGQGGGGGRE